MSLNSPFFLVFLPIVVCIHFALPRRFRTLWLLAASLIFYLSNGVYFVYGLAFCIITTYAAGLLISRKYIFPLCILLNIGLLAVLRWSPELSVYAPLGISFYLLQALGYVIDVRRGEIPAEHNFLRYALYVCFFPTVSSGPIQRSSLLLQIREGRDFDYNRARSGLYYLLGGYLLKIVLADRMGTMVDYAFTHYQELPGAALLWAVILYGLQLYCDFAGYSTLAIGTARLLGFDLAENFRQPYFSASIRDFWNRWHISLSSWLRDYLYIPLGGNRRGKPRKAINLMITFLASGLWHGTGLTFLIWGGLHGLYQIVAGLLPRRESKTVSPLLRIIGCCFTFLLVDFAWLFFRADSLSQAFGILESILLRFGLRETTYYGHYLLGNTRVGVIFLLIGLALLFLVDLLHERHVSIEAFTAAHMPALARWSAYLLLTLVILLVMVQNYGQSGSSFLYTKF